MPRQNRVDPFGQFHAVAARGAWIGNRGVLHNEAGEVLVQWRLRRWITCRLSFKDRWRPVFAPRRWSELFFLDEATAFSAGHRPCAECRRERYNEFRRAWALAHPDRDNRKLLAEDLDLRLHSERAVRGGGKKTYETNIGDLASGTFVEREGIAHLLWNGDLFPWTFSGYEAPVAHYSRKERVRVLTPPAIVATFKHGLVPQVHESVLTGIYKIYMMNM